MRKEKREERSETRAEKRTDEKKRRGEETAGREGQEEGPTDMRGIRWCTLIDCVVQSLDAINEQVLTQPPPSVVRDGDFLKLMHPSFVTKFKAMQR